MRCILITNTKKELIRLELLIHEQILRLSHDFDHLRQIRVLVLSLQRRYATPAINRAKVDENYRLKMFEKKENFGR